MNLGQCRAIDPFRSPGCEHCRAPFLGLDAELVGELLAFGVVAVRQGMTTLRDDGMRLVLTGASSVDEIRRVTGIRLI